MSTIIGLVSTFRLPLQTFIRILSCPNCGGAFRPHFAVLGALSAPTHQNPGSHALTGSSAL